MSVLLGRVRDWLGRGGTAVVGAVARHPAAWLLALVLVFVAFPGIDLGFSGLFYEGARGFFPARGPFWGFMVKATPWLAYGPLIYLTLVWLGGRLVGLAFTRLDGRRLGFLYASLLLGPALLVNLIFKETWGRARPSQILEFGGQARFTPAWMMADQCLSNCSFTSGHASLGYWTTALALLVPPPGRVWAMTAALAFGTAVGLSRIAVGGHFLSDTVFSGVFVIAINLIAYRWIVEHRPA
ncbi:phosphoesterase [Rhodospirillum rubrum]|uniref:phosphatase PAP2 family protein n=1 Tax=Rhodospirillum rubrum TaxID=1085 RepID=UPI001907466E|nr:phosphatase PAP2 family protein [Rhodospirillum rubrum]MBK1666346.1 phosphoesterase [Rhodospirillum rubrum]MBK1678540.1 phosphoesterase [Rhodospirillum rubrum]